MLLRRVIDHVRAQNRTAVAIDFVIGVLGVLIGLQFANWNDAQAAKRRAAECAQRLVVDLRDTVPVLRFFVCGSGGPVFAVQEATYG